MELTISIYLLKRTITMLTTSFIYSEGLLVLVKKNVKKNPEFYKVDL